ncbi:Uncharacterised protein [Xylophilus ampelinus]|nr:DUF3014 domain-containing protein [Variovorax sp.]VTY38021.1 Uncharacterised protein [Xylophilus ampelinus]
MTDREPDYRPAAERPVGLIVVVLLALLAAGFFGWRWWQQRQAESAATPEASVVAPPATPDDAPPAPTVAQGPQNQVEDIAKPDDALPPLADADARVRSALTELLGGKNVAAFLQMDGFVRRFVATIDNLPREHAPVQVWPARPTGGRFALSGEGTQRTVAPDNAARYTPFVRFAESVDAKQAATLYARLYPLFQQAYEELGYPGKYFNDRVVAVIDHLLAAPEPQGPIAIRVVEVKGEVPSEKPWVRYEYADPKIESLSAGQKLMVRVGLDNEQRLKARLRELRAQVATARPGGSAARP